MKNLKFLEYEEKTDTYKEVSLKFEADIVKLFGLRFKGGDSLETSPTGISYNSEELVPCGIPFEIPFYSYTPKDNEGLKSGILEDKILTHFSKLNPNIKEVPTLILLPTDINLEPLLGSPSGYGGGYVEDLVVGYRLRR